MIAETEQAVARTTAQKNIQQHECYTTTGGMSSATLKEQLGVTLLTLQRQLSRDRQGVCGGVFETMLRHYVELRFCGARYAQ
jgi:hypothetical protein